MAAGKLIKALRVQEQMTQAQLAQKAGVSVNTVRLYEGDKVEPKVATLQKIAHALDVSAYELLVRSGAKGDVKSPQNVGKRLALVRQSRGMSRELLADQAGISVEQLEQIENGTSIAPLKLKDEFCRILEMDCRWLDCGENTETHDKMMEKVLGPGDTFSVDADSEDAIRKDIMESFSKLNHDGMMEARKRIAELAQLLCYQVKASREAKEREELQKEKDAHKE